MSAPVLAASDVAGGYGTHDVLRGVHMAMQPGDFLGVVGPNGSGKSTLIKALTGLLPLRSGQVLLDGRPLSTYSRRVLAQWIGVVPQITHPPFAFTVRELVEMGRHPHQGRFATLTDDDYAQVNDALSLTDLTALQHCAVDRLSGGEYQRVIIARALAQRPRILLLDEPTAHLDIGHQWAIFELLTRLNQREGVTILCVSHDLNLAAEYCRRLVLFSEGRVFAEGTPQEVFTVERLRAVYGTLVSVEANPNSGQPVVLLNRSEPCVEESE